jgi:hypothetical protein
MAGRLLRFDTLIAVLAPIRTCIRFLDFIPGAFFALSAAMIALTPDRVVSVLATWARDGGSLHIAKILSKPHASYIVGHYGVTVVLILALCFFVEPVLEVLWRVPRERRNRPPSPDMPITRVVDYIVNGSRQRLRQSRPPSAFGLAAGRHMGWRGVEYDDALSRIHERALAGDVVVWGRREQMSADRANDPVFDGIVRPIEAGYWREAHLDPLFCFHESVRMPQTGYLNAPLDTAPDYRYTGLTLNRAQVRLAWKPKALLGHLASRASLRYRHDPA